MMSSQGVSHRAQRETPPHPLTHLYLSARVSSPSCNKNNAFTSSSFLLPKFPASLSHLLLSLQSCLPLYPHQLSSSPQLCTAALFIPLIPPPPPHTHKAQWCGMAFVRSKLLGLLVHNQFTGWQLSRLNSQLPTRASVCTADHPSRSHLNVCLCMSRVVSAQTSFHEQKGRRTTEQRWNNQNQQ